MISQKKGVEYIKELVNDPAVQIIKAERHPTTKNGEEKSGSLFAVYKEPPFAKGKFGKVYNARLFRQAPNALPEEKKKPFVIKAIPKPLTQSEIDFRELVQNEHDLCRIEPIFMKVKKPVYVPGGAFLIEEYIEWDDLEHLILQKKIQSEHVIPLIRALVIAVKEQLIDRGVVHNDLKPDNIKVCLTTMRVKILDFGLSRRKDKEFKSHGGNYAYGSPEFCRRRKTDSYSDVYSLARILAEISGGNLQTLINNTSFKLRDEIIAYAKYICILASTELKLPDENAWILPLLKKMLHPNPNCRINIKDALEELDFRIGMLQFNPKESLPSNKEGISLVPTENSEDDCEQSVPVNNFGG
ncbi:MAG: protein kinase [Tatlockia sp.]|jgi:serine/threonine protein kinase